MTEKPMNHSSADATEKFVGRGGRRVGKQDEDLKVGLTRVPENKESAGIGTPRR